MIESLKKYSGLIVAGVILIIAHKLVENYEVFLDAFDKLKVIMTPFIWAFIITYFLLGLMRFLENKLKLNRKWAFALTYLVFFGVLVLFGLMVVPVIVENVTDIIQASPIYIAKIQTLINKLTNELKLIENVQIKGYIESMNSNFSKWSLSFLNTALNSIITGLIGVTSWLFKLLFGIIISMYILMDVESFQRSAERFILVIFGESKSSGIMKFLELSDQIFKDYFVGKVIDSSIVAVICYIGLSVIGAPYAMLMSLIVGIFNMIPYIGPVIGALPAVVLTLLLDPKKALWVVIFIFVLQQVDGNIIGPKVLSDKVGVSPFGVVLAIAIGGGYFGMVGMLVSVPIYKLISILINRWMHKKIVSRKSEQKVL